MPINTGDISVAPVGDGAGNPGTSVPWQLVANMRWNGAGWDRERGNAASTPQASAAITGTANGADQTNHNGAGVLVTVNITAAGGTVPTHDLRLQYRTASGVYRDIPGAAMAQATGTGVRHIAVFPGAAAVAGESVNWNMPRTWRWVETIGGTTPTFTRTIDVDYLV